MRKTTSSSVRSARGMSVMTGAIVALSRSYSESPASGDSSNAISTPSRLGGALNNDLIRTIFAVLGNDAGNL